MIDARRTNVMRDRRIRQVEIIPSRGLHPQHIVGWAVTVSLIVVALMGLMVVGS